MRLGTAGPSRQVHDTSYYISMVRKKCEEISSEIERMQKEVEQRETDSKSLAQYERRQEDLVKRVRELEGTLADHNLALDKARGGADLADQQRLCESLQQQNDGLAQEADNVFRERQEREAAIRSVDEAMQRLRDKERERIASMPARQRAEVEELRRELTSLQEEIRMQMTRHDELHMQVVHAQSELKRHQWNDAYKNEEGRLRRLRKQQEQLEEELKMVSMDPAEAKKLVMQRAKESTAALQRVKGEMEEIEDENDALNARLGEIRREMESGGSSANPKKVEMLLKKDQEISRYIDEDFPARMRVAEEDKQSSQSMIAGLLEHISGEIEHSLNVPTKERVGELTEDLSFKRGQASLSIATHDRLLAERKKCETELDRLNRLDEKLPVQIKDLTEGIERMRREMDEFDDIPGLKKRAAEVKENLSRALDSYRARSEAAHGTVQRARIHNDAAEAKLRRFPAGKKLAAAETTLGRQQTQLFALNEFVADKAVDTNYEAIRDACMDIVTEVNVRVRDLATKVSPV